jgi:hypothetical protein
MKQQTKEQAIIMADVLADVLKERVRQNNKWGVQRHEDGRWLSILGEEFGEVCQALQDGMISQKETDANNKYIELIQVAAVAMAWAEQVRENNQN